MLENKSKVTNAPKVDTKEFEIPETMYIRDIENRVFQGIVLKWLSEIRGIGLIEGNFIDSLLGSEGVKGIYAEQDSKTQSVNIKVEVNIQYGLSIPDKAEEIQSKIAEEITKLTGLHVGSIHVVFKNIMPQSEDLLNKATISPAQIAARVQEEYSDDF